MLCMYIRSELQSPLPCMWFQDVSRFLWCLDATLSVEL